MFFKIRESWFESDCHNHDDSLKLSFGDEATWPETIYILSACTLAGWAEKLQGAHTSIALAVESICYWQKIRFHLWFWESIGPLNLSVTVLELKPQKYCYMHTMYVSPIDIEYIDQASYQKAYQQLTQLRRTDSVVGKPKFTTVQIFPEAWAERRALSIRSLWYHLSEKYI